MTSSGQPIEERNESLEQEIDERRSRESGTRYKRWQVQLYMAVTLAIGLVLGVFTSGDSSRVIPDLVRSAAPIMLVLGLLYYAYTRYELSRAIKNRQPSVTVIGNWYLASVALVALIIGTGWLLVDENRTGFEIALLADMIALVVFAAHPMTSIWRRHS